MSDTNHSPANGVSKPSFNQKRATIFREGTKDFSDEEILSKLREAGVDVSKRTLGRLKSEKEPIKIETAREAFHALGLDFPGGDASKTPPPTRRRIIRVADGQETIRALLSKPGDEYRVRVDRDADHLDVDRAVLDLCDVADRAGRFIKQSGYDEWEWRDRPTARETYELGKKIGDAARALRKHGWELTIVCWTESWYDEASGYSFPSKLVELLVSPPAKSPKGTPKKRRRTP